MRTTALESKTIPDVLLPVRCVEGFSSRSVGLSPAGGIISLDVRDDLSFLTIADESPIQLSFTPLKSIRGRKFLFLHGDFLKPDTVAIFNFSRNTLQEITLKFFLAANTFRDDEHLVYLAEEENGVGSVYQLNLNNLQQTRVIERNTIGVFQPESPCAIEMNQKGDMAVALKNGKIDFFSHGECVSIAGNSLPTDAVCTQKMLSFSKSGDILFDVNVLLHDNQKESHLVRYFVRQIDGSWKQTNRILRGGFVDGGYDLAIHLGQELLIYHQINSSLLFAIDLTSNKTYHLAEPQGKIKQVVVQDDAVMVVSQFEAITHLTIHQMESLVPRMPLLDFFNTELEMTLLAKDQDVLKFIPLFVDDIKLSSLPFVFVQNYKKKPNRKIEIIEVTDQLQQRIA